MAGYEVALYARGYNRRMLFSLDREEALQEYAHWESFLRHRGQGAVELRGPDGETEMLSEWCGGYRVVPEARA